MARSPRTIRALPSPLERPGEIDGLLAGREPAVFLDYDGTLTPIVPDPDDALLPGATRASIERLAGLCPVAVVSGRDLEDVLGKVGIDGIAYAGSHGFDLLTPDGAREERAPEALPALDRAESALRAAVEPIEGASVERKRFAIAVHFRNVDPSRWDAVDAAVDAVHAGTSGLRKTGGKRIFELRPDVAWDKGRAVRWLLEELGLDRPEVIPVYVGDDVTDEDAFEALGPEGIGVVVRDEDDERATAARYALDHPDAVRDFLDGIADLLERRQVRPSRGATASP